MLRKNRKKKGRKWRIERVIEWKCWLEGRNEWGLCEGKIVGESAPRGADQWYIITRSSSTHYSPILSQTIRASLQQGP